MFGSSRKVNYARLVEIGRDLELVIDELRPDAIAMEGGFTGRKSAALMIGAARGVAAYVAGRRGFEIREYAPSTAKKMATGNGKASKTQVAALVRARLKMKITPAEDAGDALAVAICRAFDRS